MVKEHQVVTIEIFKKDMDANVGMLATHTQDTWQPGRTYEQKVCDTRIGKIGELGFQLYLEQYQVALRTWDELRDDDGKTHAPLDGFFAPSYRRDNLMSSGFREYIGKARDGVHFGEGTYEKLTSWDIYGYEVKSTRVSERHRSDGKVSYEKLLNDRFLMYPPKRTGILTKKLQAQLLHPESRKLIEKRTPPYLIQAHVEELEAEWSWRVYLSGYILAEEFLWADDLNVTRLYQKGKSEQAIYYVLPLKMGAPIAELTMQFATKH
jgi:hypothetical protein